MIFLFSFTFKLPVDDSEWERILSNRSFETFLSTLSESIKAIIWLTFLKYTNPTLIRTLGSADPTIIQLWLANESDCHTYNNIVVMMVRSIRFSWYKTIVRLLHPLNVIIDLDQWFEFKFLRVIDLLAPIFSRRLLSFVTIVSLQ